jgi:hypothetical protein
MLLRRLPIMIALHHWIPEVKTLREAVFSGHFGPMGVGAVFISTLAVDALPAFEDPRAEGGRRASGQLEVLASTLQPIVAFIVLCSIAVHGLSIPFFSLGKRVHSMSRTWSRHASFDPSSSAAALPEWTDQTRRVVRAEDIVVNRDPGAGLVVVVPNEKEDGDGDEETEIEMEMDQDQMVQRMEKGELGLSDGGGVRDVDKEGEQTQTPGGSSSRSSVAAERQRRTKRETLLASAQKDAGGAKPELPHGGELRQIRNEDEVRERGKSKSRRRRESNASERAGKDRDADEARIPDLEQVEGDETGWRQGNDLIIERKLGPGEDVRILRLPLLTFIPMLLC